MVLIAALLFSAAGIASAAPPVPAKPTTRTELTPVGSLTNSLDSSGGGAGLDSMFEFTSALLDGDLNGDNLINEFDYDILSTNWYLFGDFPPTGDLADASTPYQPNDCRIDVNVDIADHLRDVDDLSMKWSYTIQTIPGGAVIESSPAIDYGRVFIVSGDAYGRYLYCFGDY